MWSGINFCPNEDKRYMIEINLRVSWPIIGGSRRELGQSSCRCRISANNGFFRKMLVTIIIKFLGIDFSKVN